MMGNANYRELNELFKQHPALKEAYENDATVHAWLMQFINNRCTLEEAWIGLICALSRERKHYFDEVVELTMKHGHDPRS